MAIGGHERNARGGSVEWLTPPYIIEPLGPFDLDPCAPIERPWPTAAHHFTIEDDGLAQDWEGRIWLNPPYGAETWGWMRRLANHPSGPGWGGIALLFARTETEGFHEHVWNRATALLFFRGRIHFHHAIGHRKWTSAGDSGGPSVLIAYGGYNAAALQKSRLPGKYVRLRL